jgi:patatin-like phospholipase/acyl hydrolase
MSFNAGGIRGYLSALVVQQMERDMGMPINQFVDVFSGVSIGCILSSLYALGVSSDAVVDLFESQSSAIFKPKFYYKWGIIPVKGPRYCSESLFNTLYALVGDKQLKDVNRVLIGLSTDMTESMFP